MTDDPELARIRSDLARANASRDQALRAVEAERRARVIAEARLYAYGDHQPQCPRYAGDRGACTCGFATMRAETPALVAELDAARAVVALARRGFGTEEDILRAHAFDPTALTSAIRAYDAVLGKAEKA